MTKIIVVKKQEKSQCGEFEGEDMNSPEDAGWLSAMDEFKKLKAEGKSMSEIAEIMGL